MTRFLTVLGFSLFFVAGVDAQFSKSYQAIPVLDTIPADIHENMKARLNRDNGSMEATTANKREATYMKSLNKERFEHIVDNFNKDKFIVDSELNQYLNLILENIRKGNPGLPLDIHVYLYRSSVPNAICYGEGTIVFSTSLLARLESEDQVASVLSHELAHQIKGHGDQTMKALTSLNFDKKINKEIKQIKSDSYGKYSKIKNLTEALELSRTRHSRFYEFEADSVGLGLLLNTKYNSIAAVRSMEILDSIDRPVYTKPLDLKKYFNFKDYPFKASWATYIKSDNWHKSLEVADSLKTHPNCKQRATALQRQLTRVSKWPASYTASSDDDVFTFIRTTSQFETLESEYHFKQYGKAMFRALVMLEQYPDNIYLHAMVGKCLYKLYEYQKHHLLGNVLELPDPRFEENYDRFLTFFHKLRLSELENLAYHYVTTKNESYFLDENFLYTTWLCSTLPSSKLGHEKVKDEYRERFPNGRYLKQMK